VKHPPSRDGRPQSNGFIERFHRTLLDEHLRVKGRTTWQETVAEKKKGAKKMTGGKEVKAAA
jgi:transposase InsO family protein